MSIQTHIESSYATVASKKIKDATSMISLSLKWRLYITGLITSDGVMTFAAFWVAYYLRFEWFVQSFDPNAVVFFENYRFLLYTVSFL